MSRRHTDIWNHPNHYLVDPYTWPWSPNGQDHIWPSKLKYWFKVMAKVKPIGHIWGLEFKSICLLFVSWLSGQFWLRYKNSYFTLKIQGQGHSQGQIWWSHLRPRVQSMCLLFVLWQSNHFSQRYSQFHIWPWTFKVKVMSKVKPDSHIWGLEINRYVCFLFRGNRTIFDRYSEVHIWPWKFEVKVMAKVKTDGHIWGLELIRCVCFSFRGNRAIFGWYIANSIFDLENSRSRSRRKSTKI